MADSWQRLGITLAGMGRAGDDAYRDRLMGNLTIGQKGTTLQRGQMELEGLMGMGDKLIAAGETPERAALITAAAAANAGSDISAAMEALGKQQEQRFRQGGVDSALAGDWNSANANMLGVANGPQELAAIQGDTLLGNRFVVGGDMRGPTAIGQQRIGTLAAQGRASDASAASSYASAARTRQGMGIDAGEYDLKRSGRWNPDGSTPGGGSAGKPLPAEIRMKLGMLEAAELAAQRYEDAVLPKGGGFNRQQLYVGPAGGNIEEAINNVLRVESGAAVPESELVSGVRRYGATAMNQEETARANLQQLRDKIRILRENVQNQTGMASPAIGDRMLSAQPAASSGGRRRFNPATGRIE